MRFLPLLPLCSLLALGCPADDKSTDGTDTAADTAGDTGEADPDLVGECETTACGGDPVGDWTLAGVCIDQSEQPLEECEGGWIKFTTATLSGSASINADGTYSNAFDGGSGDAEFYILSSCIRNAGCDVLESQVEGAVCAESEEGCLCTLTVNFDATSETGTWSADGTNISFTSDTDGETATGAFCADSDELWVVPPDETGNNPLESMIFSRN